MSVDASSLLKIPYLGTMEIAAIRSFISRFKIYASQGGKNAITDCIDADVLADLAMCLKRRRIVDDKTWDMVMANSKQKNDPSDMICLLRAACAPSAITEQLKHFSSTTMTNEGSVWSYIREFRDRLSELEEAHSPLAQDLHFLIASFVAGIQITDIRADVRSSRPTSLAEAVNNLQDAVERLAYEKQFKSRQQHQTHQDSSKKNKDKNGKDKNAKEMKGRYCQFHHSHSHSYEECRSNPSNRAAGQAEGAAAAASSKPAAPPQGGGQAKWSRNASGQSGPSRLTRVNMARVVDSEEEEGWTDAKVLMAVRSEGVEDKASDAASTPLPVGEDIKNPQIIPKHLGVTVHTPSQVQTHTGLCDTGADVNIVDPMLATKLQSLGCAVVDAKTKLLLLNQEIAQARQALLLDITLTSTSGHTYRTQAPFIITKCAEELLLGYNLLEEMAQHVPFCSSTSPPKALHLSLPVEKSSNAPTLPTVDFADEDAAKQQMEALIVEYEDLFRDQAPTDKIDIAPADVKLVKPAPTTQHPRRLAQTQGTPVRPEVKEWLAQDVMKNVLAGLVNLISIICLIFTNNPTEQIDRASNTEKDASRRTIEFLSKETEKRWSMLKQKVFAIYTMIKHFAYYLLGRLLVEAIQQHRRIKPGDKISCFEYYTKWKDYDKRTWEPSSTFRNNSIFNAYAEKQKLRR